MPDGGLSAKIDRMKFRHCAAIALAGWYLMLPPVDRMQKPLTNSPLSQWELAESFDQAEKCEARLATLRKTSDELPADSPERWRANWYDDSACIATDDPRLAK
jgi:hypothetical protein